MEEVFRKTSGVTNTSVGYTGGHTENPTYREVCAGACGHTEVVRVEFDPDKISYEKLLQILWTTHSPYHKSKNQYKSVVFFHDDEQKETALKSIKELETKSGKKVATEVLMAPKYYLAEEYHQQYIEKRKRKSGTR